MNKGLNIAFFGSSLVSAYWNGAATYYRGLSGNSTTGDII
jgi:spore maturation protein CgeB